jgi:hypothetical protein
MRSFTRKKARPESLDEPAHWISGNADCCGASDGAARHLRTRSR